MAPGIREAEAETSGSTAVQCHLERVIVIVAETCLDVDFSILVAEFSSDYCSSSGGVGAHRGNGQHRMARKRLLYRKAVGQYLFRQVVSAGVRARRKADGISRIKALEE